MGTILERLARDGLSERMAFGQKQIEGKSQPYENIGEKKKTIEQRKQQVQRP